MTKIPLDHLRSQKKPVTRKVQIAGDSEVAQQLLDAREALRKADARFQARESEQNLAMYSRAQQLVEDLEDQYRQTALTFEFKSLGRKRYEDLVAAHPATDEQIAETKKIDPNAIIPFNSDTFPTALIVATLSDPYEGEELEGFKWWLENEINSAEYWDLWQTALAVNTQRTIVTTGKG